MGPIPESSHRAACVAYQGRIWRCGGFTSEDEAQRSSKCFSFDGLEWGEEEAMTFPRAYHSMVASSKAMYTFGGSGTGNFHQFYVTHSRKPSSEINWTSTTIGESQKNQILAINL